MQMTHTPHGQAWGIAKEAWRVSTYSRSTSSSDMGCLLTTLLVAVCIFVPLVGHIFLTVMIIGDNLTSTEKLLWLLAITQRYGRFVPNLKAGAFWLVFCNRSLDAMPTSRHETINAGCRLRIFPRS